MLLNFNIFFILFTLNACIDAALSPSAKADYFSSPLNKFKLFMVPNLPKLTVGFNFANGHHVSFGLKGGLLAENGSPGGLHAEASTPFGQSAGAGIGIRNENGENLFYAYADAALDPNHVVGYCLLVSTTFNATILNWENCNNKLSLI